MKYSAILVSSLAVGAFAIPQGASTITAAPSVASASLTPQQSCAVACPSGDVDCQAQCVGAAHPNSSQANETNECSAKCDQGDGSPEATQKFAECLESCRNAHFPTSQTVGAAPAGSAAASGASNAASATGSAASAAESGATETATGTGSEATGSETATSSASAQSSGAANANNVQFAGAGLFGLVMAIFAL